MNALVVYDSFFGNTERVANEIGNTLGVSAEVRVLRVSEVTPEQLTGLDLLVVGSPTRGFSPTPAIRTLLQGLPKHGLRGVRVAAFDTRIAVDEVDSPILPPLVRVFGYAAEPIARRLERKGGEPAAPPAGFFVEGTEGPLKPDELERAATWARQMISPKGEPLPTTRGAERDSDTPGARSATAPR